MRAGMERLRMREAKKPLRNWEVMVMSGKMQRDRLMGRCSLAGEENKNYVVLDADLSKSR
jgi:hypothetical protein